MASPAGQLMVLLEQQQSVFNVASTLNNTITQQVRDVLMGRAIDAYLSGYNDLPKEPSRACTAIGAVRKGSEIYFNISGKPTDIVVFQYRYPAACWKELPAPSYTETMWTSGPWKEGDPKSSVRVLVNGFQAAITDESTALAASEPDCQQFTSPDLTISGWASTIYSASDQSNGKGVDSEKRGGRAPWEESFGIPSNGRNDLQNGLVDHFFERDSQTKRRSVPESWSPGCETQSSMKSFRSFVSQSMTAPLIEQGSRRKKRKSVELDGDTRMEYMFPKVDDLREAVDQALTKIRYDVEDLYHEMGCFQALARNNHFKMMSFCVIFLNALWIGIEANDGEESWYDVRVDNVFCVFFTFEIFVRFAAFANKRNAFRDGWFLFDSALCTSMVWDLWALPVFEVLAFIVGAAHGKVVTAAPMGSAIFRLFRLFRLFRIFRASRLMVAFPELLVLATGMVEGLRSVLAVLWFLFLILYVFGIIFTMTLQHDLGPGIFDNVLCSMNTLLVQVLCGPDADLMRSIMNVGIGYYAIFLAFILFANLTAMNMLIGILCDVVSNTAQDAKDEVFASEVRLQIDKMAELLDEDADGTLSKEEFDAFIHDPHMVTKCEELSVDMVGVADFGRFIFQQVDTISYAAFADLVSCFRGSKLTTRADIANLRKYLSLEIVNLENRIIKLVHAMQTQ